jgi:hypothetical protein
MEFLIELAMDQNDVGRYYQYLLSPLRARNKHESEKEMELSRSISLIFIDLSIGHPISVFIPMNAVLSS